MLSELSVFCLSGVNPKDIRTLNMAHDVFNLLFGGVGGAFVGCFGVCLGVLRGVLKACLWHAGRFSGVKVEESQSEKTDKNEMLKFCI